MLAVLLTVAAIGTSVFTRSRTAGATSRQRRQCSADDIFASLCVVAVIISIHKNYSGMLTDTLAFVQLAYFSGD